MRLYDLKKRKKTPAPNAVVIRLSGDDSTKLVATTNSGLTITRDSGHFNVVWGKHDFSASEPLSGIQDVMTTDNVEIGNAASHGYAVSLTHSEQQIKEAWNHYVTNFLQTMGTAKQGMLCSIENIMG